MWKLAAGKRGGIIYSLCFDGKKLRWVYRDTRPVERRKVGNMSVSRHGVSIVLHTAWRFRCLRVMITLSVLQWFKKRLIARPGWGKFISRFGNWSVEVCCSESLPSMNFSPTLSPYRSISHPITRSLYLPLCHSPSSAGIPASSFSVGYTAFSLTPQAPGRQGPL